MRRRIEMQDGGGITARLTAAVLSGLLAGAGGVGAALATAGSAPRSFVGSASCRECHEAFYQLWAPSHHGTAMQPFSNARTNLAPQTSALKLGAYSYQADVPAGTVLEQGPAGERRYAMAQAMGGKNVFYSLTPLERGRLQVLPLAYDVRRREWFDVARSAVRHFVAQPDEPLAWTDSAYTFNTACFSCHVSQFTNHYQLATDSYTTTWAEPGINCETCHGPASEHIRVARQTPKGQPLKELNLVSFRTLSKERINAQCGSCHARIEPMTSSFSPGDRFFDHFGLAGLESADFHPDGRELGEDFTFTSWRESACVQSGQLDCLACHTSSGRFRFAGDRANQACLPCHAEQVQNAAAHSHHGARSDGAKCVACHLPATEFARMVRTDHSMRPPMPAATLAFGSPNACNLCHTNRDAAWADRWVRQWHPRDYQADTVRRAGWLAAARKRDWSALPEIVRFLDAPRRDEIWSAAFLQLLAGCDDDAKWGGVQPCLRDPSPLVRAAAVQSLGDGGRAEFIPLLAEAARDEFRLVRLRAAAALAGVPRELIPTNCQAAFDQATEELVASFLARPDNPGAYGHLGNFRLERREYADAIRAFQTASRLAPRDPSPLVNVSLAFNALGQNAQAEASLRQALQLEPTNAAAQLNLGLLLAEVERPTEAEQAFRTALRSDPRSAQAAFNLGVLLARDHPAEALDWCRRAATLAPREAKYAYTLAFFLDQQGKSDEAVQALEASLAMSAAPADAYALLGRIYEGMSQPAKALAVYRRAADNARLPEEDRARFLARARALRPP